MNGEDWEIWNKQTRSPSSPFPYAQQTWEKGLPISKPQQSGCLWSLYTSTAKSYREFSSSLENYEGKQNNINKLLSSKSSSSTNVCFPPLPEHPSCITDLHLQAQRGGEEARDITQSLSPEENQELLGDKFNAQLSWRQKDGQGDDSSPSRSFRGPTFFCSV